MLVPLRSLRFDLRQRFVKGREQEGGRTYPVCIY